MTVPGCVGMLGSVPVWLKDSVGDNVVVWLRYRRR